jgi:predicted AAA+ superfamily ATPase
MGLSESTARRHLDLLTDAPVVRQLHPLHVNNRQAPGEGSEIYIRNTGLLHHFLGIETQKDLLRHPKVGASWEGFVALPQRSRR